MCQVSSHSLLQQLSQVDGGTIIMLSSSLLESAIFSDGETSSERRNNLPKDRELGRGKAEIWTHFGFLSN